MVRYGLSASWAVLLSLGVSGCGDGENTDGNGNSNSNLNQTEVEAVCTRWNADRQDMNEGSWNGNVATCNPGEVSAEGRANALKILNLYRWLSGLPQASENPELTRKNQQCALLMNANGVLSHSPAPSWTCYTSEGAEGAGQSCIAGSPGVSAIDLYMVDPGNEDTLGHRRWLLANDLGAVGLGSTSSYSCLWVVGTGGQADAEWTAWPPPGPFPAEAVGPGWWSSIDDTGWSLQSDFVDLTGAQVTVTADGAELPVTVRWLQGGYGSSYAVAFIPDGWTTQTGVTYHVEVTHVATPIAYDVSVVDCSRFGP